MINTLASVFLAITMAAAPGILLAQDVSQGEPEFSEAETRLWMTDQLQNLDGPVEMVYSFEKSGAFEEGFRDEVRFRVEKLNDDGTKSASVNFFSGERNFPVPPAASTTVNPVLKVYLQGDVYEMNRLTDPDGSARERWRYFQRRIKFALAESAEIKPYPFTFDGREFQGREIRFEPYKQDPKRNLFERFADKVYSFVVCDELPGYVYRIETSVPGEAGGEPLIREVLQLSSVNKVH